MRRERSALLLLGLFALLTAVVGYSGLIQRLTTPSYRELELELYGVVDAAQLWYARPESRDGGDRSFVGLDFQRLGMSDKPGAITWQGRHGKFYIERLSEDDFDLAALSPEGVRLEARAVGFDTRPEIMVVKGAG